MTQEVPGIPFERFQATYILPLKWQHDDDLGELSEYLSRLSDWIDIIVVDGSPLPLFEAHAEVWGDTLHHVPVQGFEGKNGKVAGVLTGLNLATHPRVVIADDDVRHSYHSLQSVLSALNSADLVRPQNFFEPCPWHARWDTARSLLNRALGHDYPGTYALRRAALREGYDAHVLFENLEMERTVLRDGGSVTNRPDIGVRRIPPSASHFWSQRLRQAYDSFAQPGRLLAELLLLPLLVWACWRPRRFLLIAGAAILIAERGRSMNGGRAWFPPGASLWAPVWVVERAFTSWAAIWLRLRGGVKYGNGRLAKAANPLRPSRTS